MKTSMTPAPVAATILAALLTVSAAAAPAPVASSGGGPRCSGEAAAPGQLHLQLGKSTLMRLPEAVASRSVGNPAVVQALLVAPDTLYVAGLDIGSTNMIVQGKSGLCSVIDVVVGMDAGALQASLAALMPEQRGIRVHAAADTLVLSGTVEDGPTMVRVLALASAFVRRPAQPLAGKRDGDEGKTAGEGAEGGQGGARLINLMTVSAPQQVMLEVKIAEVAKTLLDRLEANVALRSTSGSWASALLSNFLTGTVAGGIGFTKANGSKLILEADRKDSLVRILAEPTVMALSGQEGSFLAGGKIFVPVAQDNNKVTLEEKEFGVGLRFTPTVLSGGRIHLKVAPEVSELSRDGIGVSANGVSGTAIMPLITSRRATTTVQLNDGQSFAIGGLIRNNQSTNIKGLPVLGEVPVLGALFRSTDFQQDRTELLFVITAHLVKPLPANYALPTDAATPPGRAELFLGGRMEGAAPAAPAPASTPDRSSGFELK